MPTEYAIDDDMAKAVLDLVCDPTYTEFDAIRGAALIFLVAAMRKMDKDGETEPTSGEPILVRKVSAADAPFLAAHYKVYIDDFRWLAASREARLAMLHRALCRIAVETAEDGGFTLAVRKPDVIAWQENIVRFGAWEDPLLELRSNLQAAKSKLRGPPDAG